MENILAPSILSADFKILGEQIEQTEKAGAKYIHFDVMDGIFVPSISFGMPVLSALKGAVKQALDVHLMVTEPIRYVKEFAKCGADIITVHLEACEDVKATVDEIKASGVKAGITIKPLDVIAANTNITATTHVKYPPPLTKQHGLIFFNHPFKITIKYFPAIKRILLAPRMVL